MTDLHTAAKKALEAWQTSSYGRPSHHKAMVLAMTALQQALSNEALDKMAENARELGLDYDVKSDHRLMEQPAQQEPVAWTVAGPVTNWSKDFSAYRTQHYVRPVYTRPQSMTPLTDEQISSIWDSHVVPVFGKNGINPIVFARAIEAAHGIGEKK